MDTVDELASLERDWREREREYHADRTPERERAMLAAWHRWDHARSNGEGGAA